MIKASNIALLYFHEGYFCVVIVWLICNFTIQMAFLHNEWETWQGAAHLASVKKSEPAAGALLNYVSRADKGQQRRSRQDPGLCGFSSDAGGRLTLLFMNEMTTSTHPYDILN